VIGRNNLLIHPKFGPRVYVGAVITSLKLPPAPKTAFNPWRICNNCDNCVKACPIEAIDPVKGYNRQLCLRRREILRKGCADACAMACPIGMESMGKLKK